MIPSLAALQPALTLERGLKDSSDKIQRLSEGTIGSIDVAAQEVGSGNTIAVNGDEGQLRLSDLTDI